QAIQYPLVLSAEQYRLWLLHQGNPNAAYNIPLVIRFHREFTGEAIDRALHQLLSAHASLRMRFVEQGGTVLQLPVAVSELAVAVRDIESAALPAEIAAESNRCFRLDEQACAISRLCLDNGQQVLLFNIHHICFDGQSITPLMNAFAHALEGRELSENTSFEHFVLWQQGEAYAAQHASDMAFWQEKLEHVAQTTSLPSDLSAEMGTQSAQFEYALNEQDCRGVSAMCTKLGITEFSFWFALVSLVLGRLNNTRDVILATPVANRLRANDQDGVGFYANTLMLRQAWQESASLGTLLLATQEMVTDSMIHQSASLDKLMASLKQNNAMAVDVFSEVLFTVSQEHTAAPWQETLSLSTG
ncbi:hypothetical protein HG263_22140, partial [Pseudoalteromonas sp. JBTF-M23]